MKKSKQTPKDIIWNKAFQQSGVSDEYESLTKDLLSRYKQGKKGDAFFSEADFGHLGPLVQAERKLYSAYTHRTIEGYDDLSEAEKTDINRRLEQNLFKQNPYAYITVEYVKNIIDPDYKSEESISGTSYDNLEEALKATLKEKKIKGNHNTIAALIMQGIQLNTPEIQQLLFKVDLDNVNFKEIEAEANNLKVNLSTEQKIGGLASLKLLAKSRYQKEPEDLMKLYGSTPESIRDRIIAGKSPQKQETGISKENLLIGTTMGLMATEAGLSLFSDKNPKDENGEPKKQSSAKLAFRKVISVAATVSTIALGGYFAMKYLNSSNQTKNFSNETQR